MKKATSTFPTKPNLDPKATLLVWLVPFLLSLLLYGFTCQKTTSWQDSGMFQYRIRHGDYSGELGIALAHPTYIGLARGLASLPVGNFYWRVNILSSLAMAVTVGNFALVVFLLTRKAGPAIAASGMLAVMHISWWLGTIAEVYTLSAAGLTSELVFLVCLLQRPRTWMLMALGLLSGLGWGVHNFSLLAMPVYLVVTLVLLRRKRLPWGALPAAMLVWVIGALPNLVLIWWEATASGLIVAVRSALFGRFQQQVLNPAAPGRFFKINMALTALSFASFVLPLAALGAWRWKRWMPPTLAISLAAVTVIHVLFFVRYPVPDQFTFLLPSAVMIALWAGVGLANLMSSASRRWRIAGIAAAVASIVLPPLLYASGPWLAKQAGISVQRERPLMYRNEIRYWLVPWKHDERSAQQYADHAIRQVTSGTTGQSVILADTTTYWPIELTREDRRLAEVSVGTSERILRGLLPTPSTDFLREWVRESRVYTVRPRERLRTDQTDLEVDSYRPQNAPLWKVVGSDPSR
ncbi:MAG: protein O-mannosyl-transferase family [Phycisphaerae bacterium]